MNPEKAPLIPTTTNCESHPATGIFPSAEYEIAQERGRRYRRRKRIITHIFAFFILFFGVKLLFHSAHHFDGHRHDHYSHHPHWNGGVWMNQEFSDSEWPIPPELTVQECADWSEGERIHSDSEPFSLEHIFKLPISSESLFLVSRGPFSTGHVTIVQSDEEGDEATVSIVTNYNDEHLLELIKLCSVVAGEGENGAGIFTIHPHHRGRHSHRVRFDVTVTLPKGSGDSPLVVPEFKTEMGIFGQEVANLANSVFFDSISLQGGVGAIKVESLAAGTATFSTTNSPIKGNFTARDSLKLSTANAKIDVNVTMLNTKSEEENWSSLSINTANAPIDASVSLFSLDSEENTVSGGAFSVEAHTARGAVRVNFPTAPINSTLRLNAETAMAPVDVQMHNTFEGSFSAHSTPFNKVTVATVDTEDPEGKNRKRNLIFDSVSQSSANGYVFWGDSGEGKDRGLVKLNTALSHISLSL